MGFRNFYSKLLTTLQFKYLIIKNMKHILFQKALVYKKRKEIIPPKDYEYDYILGAWVNKLSNLLLINSVDFKGQATKKLDVETGEDNKGQ